MRPTERDLDQLIRNIVSLDEMQFGLVPGRSTTGAIFLVRQLEEQYLTKTRPLFLAFIDMDKAFDRVLRSLIWWTMRKLGIEEWLVRAMQEIYRVAVKKMRVGNQYSDEIKAAKNSKEYLLQIGFPGDRLMTWLLCSLDLNPIENVWSVLKRRDYQDERQFSSKVALWGAIVDAAQSMTQEDIITLINSMDQRISFRENANGHIRVQDTAFELTITFIIRKNLNCISPH
ncbi:uncharacterized protein LOC106873253 [Octopus bimaculoides]|uniref:uncharacterized protein LOC106873253 n=1 Tax=Octopus bimaculoides TaxID=37653 RepID=UPI00071DBF91|nr:uncharacterized protein LOC106873253 [Octopus bimaculoides]|eukprot:XP_014776023.1 PREDICTED: uncharacterized protein LOC106873253 [Octopus bimaculoides]